MIYIKYNFYLKSLRVLPYVVIHHFLFGQIGWLLMSLLQRLVNYFTYLQWN